MLMTHIKRGLFQKKYISKNISSQFRKRKRSLFSFLFFLVFFWGTLFLTEMRSFAASPTDDQKEQLGALKDTKEDQLDTLKDKIKTYQKIADLKDRESDQLSSVAKQLGAQANVVQGTIVDNERKLADLGQQIESVESRITEKERIIRAERQSLAAFLRLYFDHQSRSGDGVSILLAKSVDFEDIIKNRDDFFEAGSSVQKSLAEIANLRNSLVRDRDLVKKKKENVVTIKSKLEEQNEYLESSKKSKEALAAKAAAEQAKYEGIVSELEKERKAIEEEIEQLEDAKEGKIDLSTIPNFQKGILGYPVEEPRITQKYGKTTFTRWYKFHNGIDFADSAGTPILAAEGGKVIATGDLGKVAYGKWIAIEHKNGLTTLYGHLSKNTAKKGDSVKRGQEIGLMGSTGYSTGSHVHFGVYASDSFELTNINGRNVPTGAHINPANYL